MHKITTINITTPLRNIMGDATGDATGVVTKTKAKRGARNGARKPHSLAILLPLFMLLLTLSPIHNAWGSKEEMYKKYQHLTPDQLHRGLSQFKQSSYCQNYGYDNPNCATDRENMIAALEQLIEEKNTPMKTATAKPPAPGDADIVGSSGRNNIVGGEGNDGVGSSPPKEHTKDYWVNEYRSIPPKALKDKLGVVQDSNYCKNNDNFKGCEEESKAQAAAYQHLINEQSSSTGNTGKPTQEAQKPSSTPKYNIPKEKIIPGEPELLNFYNQQANIGRLWGSQKSNIPQRDFENVCETINKGGNQNQINQLRRECRKKLKNLMKKYDITPLANHSGALHVNDELSAKPIIKQANALGKQASGDFEEAKNKFNAIISKIDTCQGNNGGDACFEKHGISPRDYTNAKDFVKEIEAVEELKGTDKEQASSILAQKIHKQQGIELNKQLDEAKNIECDQTSKQFKNRTEWQDCKNNKAKQIGEIEKKINQHARVMNAAVKKGLIPQAANFLASDLSNLEDGICEIVKILERDVAYVVAVLAIIVLAIKGMFLGLKPMDILVCLISLSLLAGGHREVLYAIFEEKAFLEACDGPKSSGGGSSGGGSGGSGGSSYTGSPGYPGTGGGYGGGSRNYYPVSNQDGTRSSSGSDGSSGTVRGDRGYRTPPFSSGGPDGNYDYGYLDGKGGIKFDPYTGEYISGSSGDDLPFITGEVPECDPPYNMENCKLAWWNESGSPPDLNKNRPPAGEDWSGIQNPNTPGILPLPIGSPDFPGLPRPNFPGGGYNGEPNDIGVGGWVDLNIRDLPPWVNALPTMDKSDEDFKQTCNQARIYANDMNRELRNSKQSGSNITEVDACRGNPHSDLCKLTAVYRRNFNSFITNASSNGKLKIASSNENMFIVPKCPNF